MARERIRERVEWEQFNRMQVKRQQQRDAEEKRADYIAYLHAKRLQQSTAEKSALGAGGGGMNSGVSRGANRGASAAVEGEGKGRGAGPAACWIISRGWGRTGTGERTPREAGRRRVYPPRL